MILLKYTLDHPKMEKIIKMLNWLNTGDTMFDKLKIRFYSDFNRGVCVRRKIVVILLTESINYFIRIKKKS